jgi:hypothetical protein
MIPWLFGQPVFLLDPQLLINAVKLINKRQAISTFFIFCNFNEQI